MFAKGLCLILPLGMALTGAVRVTAQTPIEFNGQYDEDFDQLGPAGTTLPAGWDALRIAGSGTLGESLELNPTTGTATGGGIYNTGSAGDPDRALGTLASGSTVPAFGLRLVNTTGDRVDTLFLGGRMEQWRSGSSATTAETVVFEYSLDAAGIGDAEALWTTLPSFDLPERVLDSTSAGALDGNASENQWTLDTRIDGLNWAETDTLTLRWSDSDAPSSDGLYALDDLAIRTSVTAVPEPAEMSLIALGLGALLLRRRVTPRSRRDATP